MKKEIDWMEVIVIISILGMLSLIVIGFVDSFKKERLEAYSYKKVELPRKSGIYMIEYDKHDYVWFVDGSRAGVCHKADCKYCQKESK